jgi:mono/diheme cytochrome c family protein
MTRRAAALTLCMMRASARLSSSDRSARLDRAGESPFDEAMEGPAVVSEDNVAAERATPRHRVKVFASLFASLLAALFAARFVSRAGRALLGVVGTVAGVLSLSGCPKERADSIAGAGVTAAAATVARGPTEGEGRALVVGSCLSCHGEQMLAQQRLTEGQWRETVTRMFDWGAPIEPREIGAIVGYLAATYGTDAGPFVPDRVTAIAAAAELAPQDDGPFAGGEVNHGRLFYVDRCSACHGQNARGHRGVGLIDRPILYRAADFANIVRRGRGKMQGRSHEDRDIADILAHLRSLRNPIP